MGRRTQRWLVASLAWSAAACGGNSTPVDTGVDVADAAVTDMGVDAATDVVDGSDGSDASDAPVDTTQVVTSFAGGHVDISQFQFMFGGSMYPYASEHAEFTQIMPSNGVMATLRQSGPCSIEVIQPQADANINLNINVSAGAVTISDPTGSYVLSPGDGGTYTDMTQNGTSTRWMGGDTVTVTAAGGQVPAFTGTVVIPPRVDITSPTMASVTEHVTISKSGFTAQWISTGNGTIGVEIVQEQADRGVVVEIACTAPFTDGMIRVPSDALADLETGVSGSATLSTLLAIAAVNSTIVNAGGTFPVTLNAFSGGVYASGDVVN